MLFLFNYGAVPAVLLGKMTLAQALAQVIPREVRAAVMNSGTSFTPLQPIWLTVFTSMFMHGSVMHVAGNMLYLWIFGNNVEDVLGHGRFIVFYLLCGCLAAGAQILMSASSPAPMIGASGAIAGVLGAYYMKFPQARVQCLVFLFFFITVVYLPAGLVLLLWFLFELLRTLQPQSLQGGVAVFAHVGGFLAGWVLVRRFEPARRTRFR
jgi:membrane associated rhomboid family serine protease